MDDDLIEPNSGVSNGELYRLIVDIRHTINRFNFIDRDVYEANQKATDARLDRMEGDLERTVGDMKSVVVKIAGLLGFIEGVGFFIQYYHHK